MFATGAVCGSRPQLRPECLSGLTPVGHTAIFDLGFGNSATTRGPWTAGPDFPNGEGTGNSFANLLPNGHVLVETNPAGTVNDPQSRYARIASHAIHPVAGVAAAARSASTPVWRFYEFDGSTPSPRTGGRFFWRAASTLLLPTGEVMLNGQAVYATFGLYQASVAADDHTVPTDIAPGGSYEIFGRQLNGLSQANAFGDEFQVATNYPLVRITNSSTDHVTYAPTHHFSSMGVATGARIVSTRFDVPQEYRPGRQHAGRGRQWHSVAALVHHRRHGSGERELSFGATSAA